MKRDTEKGDSENFRQHNLFRQLTGNTGFITTAFKTRWLTSAISDAIYYLRRKNISCSFIFISLAARTIFSTLEYNSNRQ